jgi:hypothetical protein
MEDPKRKFNGKKFIGGLQGSDDHPIEREEGTD